ncbi:MAG: hypothetical protein WBC05_15695 [Sedimentisphaerales bacterium]
MFKRLLFVIESFFRYWDIDESEPEYFDGHILVEPKNETMEYGIQLTWMF